MKSEKNNKKKELPPLSRGQKVVVFILQVLIVLGLCLLADLQRSSLPLLH